MLGCEVIRECWRTECKESRTLDLMLAMAGLVIHPAKVKAGGLCLNVGVGARDRSFHSVADIQTSSESLKRRRGLGSARSFLIRELESWRDEFCMFC